MDAAGGRGGGREECSEGFLLLSPLETVVEFLPCEEGCGWRVMFSVRVRVRRGTHSIDMFVSVFFCAWLVVRGVKLESPILNTYWPIKGLLRLCCREKERLSRSIFK